MKYRRVIAEALQTPWALLPAKLAELQGLLADRARGVVYSEEEIQARIGDKRAERIAEKRGSVAVLPVVGTLTQRAGMFDQVSGLVAAEDVGEHLRAMAADDGIKAIVLDIDSPGGSVAGIEELALELLLAREKKPVVAVANSMAASAAYWIASQASEVVVTPSGTVGSIGVYSMHVDQSAFLEKQGLDVSLIHAGEHKVEGNPFGPLEDDARAEMQRTVEEYYEMFSAAVLRGRPRVSSDAMQGRMYSAARAVKIHLADRVATLGETVERFGGRPPGRLTSTQRAAMQLQTL